MSGSVREFAPAKINLALHVLGRRDDGYHELDSIVAFADVGDELTLAIVLAVAPFLITTAKLELDLPLNYRRQIDLVSGIGTGHLRLQDQRCAALIPITVRLLAGTRLTTLDIDHGHA